jgi:dethiobiotin synthetase
VTATVVVTGTDTGVGKTIVTAGLAALARARGERVAVVKPAQTGVRPGEPGDLEEVRRLSGVSDLHELSRFADPLAPATAARRTGVSPVSVESLAGAISGLRDRDLVLVEGAGGLLVHLDAAGATLADLAVRLGAPAVVVVRAGLGTLNASALTCEALRSRGVDCLGLVIGAWPRQPGLATRCNVDDLPAYTGFPLLGRLPEDAARLSPAEFLNAVRAGLGSGTGDHRARLLTRSEVYA